MLLIQKDVKLCDSANNLLLAKYLRSQPSFRWCSNPAGCGSGCELDGDVEKLSFFKCRDCKFMTCINHRVPWHSGKTCAEFDQQIASNEETSNTVWKLSNSKKCPKCKRDIEKADGCDVMACCVFGDDTCRRRRKTNNLCDHGGLCGQRFCWACLGLID